MTDQHLPDDRRRRRRQLPTRRAPRAGTQRVPDRAARYATTWSTEFAVAERRRPAATDRRFRGLGPWARLRRRLACLLSGHPTALAGNWLYGEPLERVCLRCGKRWELRP